MHYIKKRFISLPGLYPIPSKKDYIVSDMIFFILFVAFPSSFFALVPQTFFYKPGLYDLNLIFFLSGLGYFFLYFKHLLKIWRLPSGKYFILLCVYLIFQFYYSYLYQEIPIREVITVFRKNFFWPIATLGFLLYVTSMNSYRIERFFRWLFIVTVIMAFLYIFSNLSGINIWGAKVKDAITFEGTLLMQNVYAIPRYLHILFVFALISSMVDSKFRNYWMWVFALIVTILSFVRNQMMVYALYAFLIYFFTKITNITTNITKTVKQLFLLLVAAILLLTIFPKHLDRLLQKFGFYDVRTGNIVYKVDNLNTGTYDFRIRLIEEAYERIEKNLVFGNGYIREARIGTYDFVLGGDSLVPAVLFTEGAFGLTMRWLPLIVLLFYAIKYIFRKKAEYKLYWLVIIVVLLPQFINIVQTTVYTEYNQWYFIFMTLLILANKLIKENKEKHSEIP